MRTKVNEIQVGDIFIFSWGDVCQVTALRTKAIRIRNVNGKGTKGMFREKKVITEELKAGILIVVPEIEAEMAKALYVQKG